MANPDPAGTGDGGAGPGGKRFLLRLDERTYEALRAWAEQDMRSVNGQILYLLAEALRRRRGAGPDRADPP